jgi:hypothetical protein
MTLKLSGGLRFGDWNQLIPKMKQKNSKLKARILAAHKHYSSLQTIFRSKQIH